MTGLPRQLRHLTGAVLADGRVVDLTLDDGVVSSVTAARGASDPAADALDLAGFVLLPASADPHAHLDKAGSWDAIRPPMGDLESAIASWRQYASTMTVEDVVERARAQALTMLANGTTAIRSHCDLLPGDEPLRGVEAMLRVRDELADLMDIELVALAGHDVPTSAVEAALDAGVDTVGGAPHLAPDPIRDLTRLLEVAERRGVAVDLHTDESLAGAVTLDEFASIVSGRAERGWNVLASAGHCVRLSTMDVAWRDAVIEAAVAAGIAIIANPITNLYLQGWDTDVATPRGITPARHLLDAGAVFAAGADNVRDPFNPLGRSDALETAMLLVAASHLTVNEAYAAVSTGARRVMGLPPAGPAVGLAADLIAVRGSSLADVIANAPADRHVIRRGRLVASTRTERAVAVPAPIEAAR